MKGKAVTNYLDDFLFLVLTWLMCNNMIQEFLWLCADLNLPVALEKTEWADFIVVFLGILLNGKNMTLSLPVNKQVKVLRLLNDITGKKRVKVKNLQVLTGYLNFLTKAIFAGRTFTRRMYLKFAQIQESGTWKSYHHVPEWIVRPGDFS